MSRSKGRYTPALHVVRHKASGHILPQRKGASYWEPGHRVGGEIPRLFLSYHAASVWLITYERGEYTRDENGFVTYERVPGRSRADFEILPVTLTFGEPS